MVTPKVEITLDLVTFYEIYLSLQRKSATYLKVLNTE